MTRTTPSTTKTDPARAFDALSESREKLAGVRARLESSRSRLRELVADAKTQGVKIAGTTVGAALSATVAAAEAEEERSRQFQTEIESIAREVDDAVAKSEAARTTGDPK